MQDLAAVLHGAPVQTYDIDVVYLRESANIDGLVKLLAEMDATRYGDLDLLGTVGQGLGYSELLPCSAQMDIGEGLLVRVLNLETVISTKEHAGPDKDKAVLPMLRQALRLIREKEK
jgi:hypothetical protein